MSKSLSALVLASLSLAVSSATAGLVVHNSGIISIPGGYSQGLTMGADSVNSADIYIKNFFDFSNGGSYQSVYVPFFPGKVITNGQYSQAFGYSMAKLLSPGDVVGPDSFTNSNYQPLLSSQTFGDGPWYAPAVPVDGFVGFAYPNGFDGQGHALIQYAYLDIRVTALPNEAANVDVIGWAYDSTPGTAVTVAALPEPTAAGIVLLAAPLLGRRRR